MSEWTWRRWAMTGATGGIIWQSKWHIVNDLNGRLGQYSMCGVRLYFKMPFPDQKSRIEPGEDPPRDAHQCRSCVNRATKVNQ